MVLLGLSLNAGLNRYSLFNVGVHVIIIFPFLYCSIYIGRDLFKINVLEVIRSRLHVYNILFRLF